MYITKLANRALDKINYYDILDLVDMGSGIFTLPSRMSRFLEMRTIAEPVRTIGFDRREYLPPEQGRDRAYAIQLMIIFGAWAFGRFPRHGHASG